MELTFDYFRNAQDVELYLCNPNKAILGTFVAKNRNLTLRFNDISELSFEVPKYISNNTEENIEQPYYSRIATRRLIKIDKIGYFKIKEAIELENAEGAYKTVTAESHQCVFKDVGFVTENRLYKFYDENDPYDEKYDATNEKHIPSVVGQLYQQLGILCDLTIGDVTPSQDYDDWRIIWIEPALYYDENKEANVCRTLKANEELFGYDFMVGDVGNAFQVFFEFDFLHHTIKVKGTSTVAQKTNIYLSFENLIQELNLEEKSEDIVTVLACEGGNGIDITSVNPMGTNYICDFSYYMGNDVDGYPWMSKELTDKLKTWQQTVTSLEPQYSNYVSQLQDLYLEISEYESKKAYIEQKLQDTDNARDQYITNPEENGGFTFVGETVAVGEKSRISTSGYFNVPFSGNDTCTCYKEPPTYDANAGVFIFSADAESMTGTFTECFTAYFDSDSPDDIPFYFMDGATNTYCKITGKVSVDENGDIIVDESGAPVYETGGFERYALYRDSGFWCNIYSAEEAALQSEIDDKMGDETNPASETVRYIEKAMKDIADQANIINQFADSPALLRELKCYWIDGKYTNDTIEKLDDTTVAENLNLAKELMEAGKVELARVCQPRFSFELTSANFLRIYQFVKFAEELALGKVVTIEKNEGVHYYPALTEMSFSLDVADEFTLVFSNSLKLTDWGYTYADLIKSLSDTARTVSANWNDLMDYSENKETINKMLVNTLDRTLRVGMANAYNQEFIVDNTGILGRKLNKSGTYDNEQLRMINNLLLFTRDNWQTASTALGKISYEKPDGTFSEGYGLATEVLIGAMIMGDNLWIGNKTGSVKIDKDGIVISNGSISSADYSYNEEYPPYATSGIMIDLGEHPYIRATNFAITEYGDAYFKGNLEVESLTSENFNITRSGDVSCRNITINGGVIQSSNFTAEEIQESFTGSKIIITPTSLRPSVVPPSGSTSYYTYRITGSFAVDGADGITNASRSGAITYTFEGASYSVSSIDESTIEYDGNIITYSFKVKTQEHPYNLQLYGTPYNFTFIIGYTAYKTTGYECTAGSMINLGSNPYIIFPKFSVDASGKLTATSGNIGCLNISEDGRLYTNYFSISSDGKLTATEADISGNIRVNAADIVGELSASQIDVSELVVQELLATQTTYNSSYTVTYTNSVYTGGRGLHLKYNQQSSSLEQEYQNLVDGLQIVHRYLNDSSGTLTTLGEGIIMSGWGGFSLECSIGTGHLYGTWVNNDGNGISSDINKKNTIEDLGDEYSNLFDRLRPVRFKYNHGTSGRYHSGFIAQEVRDAIVEAGLQGDEFAAYFEVDELNDEDKQVRSAYLRYSEFIALCVLEIQKLKKELKEIKGNET